MDKIVTPLASPAAGSDTLPVFMFSQSQYDLHTVTVRWHLLLTMLPYYVEVR